MTFKAGDLVVLIRASNPVCKHLIGSIRTLDKRRIDKPTSWYVLPPAIGAAGREVSWAEIGMRPIRDPGNDAVDEVIQRLGTPHKEVA